MRNLVDVGHKELCVHSSPLLSLVAIVTLSNDRFPTSSPSFCTRGARERRLVVGWDLRMRSRLSRVRCPSHLQQCGLWLYAACENFKFGIAESRPPSPSKLRVNDTQIMMPSKGSIRPSVYLIFSFSVSSSFFPFTFTSNFLHSTFRRPVSLSFSTLFSFFFLHSATVLLEAKQSFISG